MLRFFISPQFGNVDIGRILPLTPNQATMFVNNGLVEIMETPQEEDPAPVTPEKKKRNRCVRSIVAAKKVESYYTLDHPVLLTRLKKIFKIRKGDEDDS